MTVFGYSLQFITKRKQRFSKNNPNIFVERSFPVERKVIYNNCVKY